jgi:general L-amino acid transport system permease protein
MRVSLSDPIFRGIVLQVVVVGLVAAGIWFLVANTMHNLEVRKIASGFGFLSREAGLPIGDSPFIDYTPELSYTTALIVGILNTVRVAVVAIILATILGTLLGIARLSKNWLLSRCAQIYVEVMRNLPLLLQLLFWWALFRESLPGPREAIQLGGSMFLSNRGFKYPLPIAEPPHWWILAAAAVGILATWTVARWAKARQIATGQQFPVGWAGLGLVVGFPFLVFLVLGAPLTLDRPALRGFNFAGGGTLTPEFAALLIGLVTYTAAFVAEIVRSGILAVPHGQSEAAGALGLSRSRVLRLVVLPQALRVIVPPMTSQYLNITKNSSLAVAIGYPDLVSIANTTMNQTGQAIEGVAIIMAVYLTISLSISLFMNWYNKHIALVER